MKEFIKKWFWKSRLRFYILNLKWNVKFWLFSKKIYKTVTYNVPVQDFFSDYSNKMYARTKTVTKKRFEGFLYEYQIYQDNPGIPNIDRETWLAWKKKGLIK